MTAPFNKKNKSSIEVVQTILEPILLRRTKDMKLEDGTPIVDLRKFSFDISFQNSHYR